VLEQTKLRASGAWRDVANDLQDDILFGRLQPRQHLIEDEIMAQTGASRHAVRRAFEELERAGLVVRLPNRGVRVRSYSPEEVEDLFELRETLEMKAALRIKLPAPRELIDALDAIQRRHEQASAVGDVMPMFNANNEFHERLYSACGNQVLAAAIRAYSWQTHPIRMRFITNREGHDRAVEQHWRMIRLLSGHDNQALADLCYDHLQPSKRFYLSLYGKAVST
jgi:DNA-binding GntR family transcriptional regulator